MSSTVLSFDGFYEEFCRRRDAERREAWNRKNPEKARQSKSLYKKRHRVRLAGRPMPDICEVCGRPPGKKGVLSFDHCHASGRFRGWLCTKCNNTLGMVDDNPELLRKLAEYLERPLDDYSDVFQSED